MSRVSTKYKPHQRLEKDVALFLRARGFLVDSASYHEKMDKDIVSVLQNIYTPTALYLRGRADRIAVCKELLVVFEWEAKTHKSKNRHDCLLEALPVCHHLAKSPLGVKCLYVYRNPFEAHELDVGFWIDKMPPVRVIMIPERWQRVGLEDYFRRQFKLYFPEIDVIPCRSTRDGSDDPFLIIDESDVASLPHWKDLIRGELPATSF